MQSSGPQSSRRRLAAVVLLGGVLGPAASAEAVTRYAANYRFTMNAGAAPCTDVAKPCLLTVALGAAVANDEVVLSPGNYRKPGIGSFATFGAGGVGPLAQQPYEDPVVVPDRVTLRGQGPTAALSTIYVAPNSQAEAGLELGARAVLRDVAVVSRGTGQITYSVATGVEALVDRVQVRTINADSAVQIGIALGNGATVRSSVSYGTGTATDGRTTAIGANSPNQTATIRNTVAYSPEADGVGIASGTSNGVNTVTISNSIARGGVGGSDIRVRAGLAGGAATTKIDHSNWNSQEVSLGTGATGATATLTQTGPNQNAGTFVEPLFFDAAGGDFRQLAGSPTINAGVVDPGNGPRAFGGHARQIGLTTDIGSDEFDPAAPPMPLTPPVEPDPEPTPDPTPPPAPPTATPVPLSQPVLDRTPPKLTGLALASKVKRTKGTTIKFTLSEAATVKLAFGQPTTGRTAASGKCTKLTSKNRTKKKCTLANVRGTLTLSGQAGANRVSFKGTLTAKKQLALGRYTLVASATDAAGNTSAAASKRFTLAAR